MDGRSDARTAVLPAWSRIRRRTSAHTQFGYATTMTRKVASSVGAISFASLNQLITQISWIHYTGTRAETR